MWLVAASASKKASNTPAQLRRQKRFQSCSRVRTRRQGPPGDGVVREVMQCRQELAAVPAPVAPSGATSAEHLQHDPQSSSVMPVSMVGLLQTDPPEVTDPLIWESTRSHSTQSVHRT